MKVKRRSVLTILAGSIFWLPFAVNPAQPKDSENPKRQPQPSPAATSEAGPRYVPSKLGAPGGRVGGGTRGPASGRDIFVLSVLAPDHTGLTVREQPCLFWFISAQTTLPVEVTIVDPNAVAPLLQTRIASSVDRGVHRVSLAEHGVRLAPGVAYQWSVAVVTDDDRRAHDILASGTIERVKAEQALVSKLSGAGEADKVGVYAEAGIWYDALETVSDLIDRSPQDPIPRRFRAALLAQVGLPEVTE